MAIGVFIAPNLLYWEALSSESEDKARFSPARRPPEPNALEGNVDGRRSPPVSEKNRSSPQVADPGLLSRAGSFRKPPGDKHNSKRYLRFSIARRILEPVLHGALLPPKTNRRAQMNNGSFGLHRNIANYPLTVISSGDRRSRTRKMPGARTEQGSSSLPREAEHDSPSPPAAQSRRMLIASR